MSESEVSEALDAINKCLIAVGKRLEAIEKCIQELPTPDKTYNKPRGAEEYITLKENFDLIYERLGKLEDGM